MEKSVSEEFLENVANNYDNLIDRFSIICLSHNTKLDMDIFHDTIIKCATNVNHPMDYEELCKYLYGSYKMNILREKEYARNKHEHKSIDTLDINYLDRINTCDYIESNVDITSILDDLEHKFGKDVTNLYLMKLEGYTMKEMHKETKMKSIQHHLNKVEDYIENTYK